MFQDKRTRISPVDTQLFQLPLLHGSRVPPEIRWGVLSMVWMGTLAKVSVCGGLQPYWRSRWGPKWPKLEIGKNHTLSVTYRFIPWGFQGKCHYAALLGLRWDKKVTISNLGQVGVLVLIGYLSVSDDAFRDLIGPISTQNRVR